jgi:hypothetical protein
MNPLRGGARERRIAARSVWAGNPAVQVKDDR